MSNPVIRFLSSIFLVLAFSVAAWAQGLGVSFEGLSTSDDHPIEVSADRLQVDQDNGDALFSGNVVIAQGTLRLAAEDVAITYTDDGGMSEMVATGGVIIVTDAEEIEAQNVTYNLDAEIMILTGDVLFLQGRTSLASERMRIDVASNTGVLEGRVRSVIQPQ